LRPKVQSEFINIKLGDTSTEGPVQIAVMAKAEPERLPARWLAMPFRSPVSSGNCPDRRQTNRRV